MPDNSVAQALGNLYLIMNRPVTHQSPKIQPADTRKERLALAITYCFDIQRKLEYACYVLEQFARHADPKLARQLLKDDEELCRPKVSWAKREKAAHRIMLEVYAAIHETHANTLSSKAKKARGGAAYPPGRKAFKDARSAK